MKRLVFFGALALSSAAGGRPVEAHWGFGFPWFVQPYPYFVESSEVWRDVHYAGTVAWELDSHSYCLGPDGYRCDGQPAVCDMRFVEPFDCWGNRIVKSVQLPVQTEYTQQQGIKTIAFVGGRPHLATWILTADNRIKQVWIRVEDQVERAPVEATPVPEYSPAPEQIPMRSTTPALPAPPSLPEKKA